VGLDRDLIHQVRALDEFDLRRLVIFVTGLLDARTGTRFGVRPVGGDHPGAVSYRQQWVRCGKKACTTCPHGPYWYGYRREGGRLRSRYVGKEAPEGVSAPASPPVPRPSAPTVTSSE
jgi:hypothetical protein